MAKLIVEEISMKIREILTESSDGFILYINNKPVTKYASRKEALDQRDTLRVKYPDKNIMIKHEVCDIVDVKEACWKNFKAIGMKKKNGKTVPNCVPANEDWQSVNKKDNTDGMSKKAVSTYRRENPGSKLKTAVTKKPSEIKKGSSDDKRRKSYCARSNGQKKMHNIDCSATPDKPVCKARRRWNCE